MDSTARSVAAQASCSKLLPHDDTDLMKVSNYAADHKDEVKKISTDCDKKGYLKLLWDSKVPEKDKRFYNFLSVHASNCDEILAEIKKYLDFYDYMKTAVDKVRSDTEGTDDEDVDPYTIIMDLNERLCEMRGIAKKEKNLTTSSTLFDLHASFIQKHEKLENMIKRVECVALKSSMRRTMDGWQKAITDVGDLKVTLKKCENKFDHVRLETEELKEMNRSLIESNKALSQNQKLLMEKNGRMEDRLNTLIGVAETMAKQQNKLMRENTSLIKIYANKFFGGNNNNN